MFSEKNAMFPPPPPPHSCLPLVFLLDQRIRRPQLDSHRLPSSLDASYGLDEDVSVSVFNSF